MSEPVDENHRGRILIVDDTLANLKVLSALLSTAGYSVGGAPNGKTALMICHNRPPELVLLDIRMPDMDGYEVCRRLKGEAQTKDIQIIFISALNDVGDKVKGFEVGAVDYITKPFQENEVLARVQTHISLSRMQKEQKQVNEKLRELDNLRSLFIASMSHELRTPLNSIISFNGILLQNILGELNPRQRDSLERMHRASKHLLELIIDVIDISKIEAGRIDVHAEDVNVETLVGDALDTVRLQAQEKGLQLVIETSSWPSLHTDSRRLKQCLVNLLNNAVKYTEQGRISVAVRSDDDTVSFEVRDTGIGIAEQKVPKLFQAFERLDSRFQGKISGTGLGLYLTRKMAVDLLQGNLTGHSVAGEGSTFTLHVASWLADSAPSVQDLS